jgi:hypothetical protein
MVSMQSDKVKYSPYELRLLSLFPKGGKPISSLELADKLYAPSERPRNYQASCNALLTGLIRKVDENKPRFKIVKQRGQASRMYFRMVYR